MGEDAFGFDEQVEMEDDAARYWSKSWNCFRTKTYATSAFETWGNVEALVDETPMYLSCQPKTNVKPSAPEHLGYSWDGVVYKKGYVGNKTLEQHAAYIEALKLQLKELQKQSLRYKALEKKGL